MIQIEKKIVNWEVIEPNRSNPPVMNEQYERPEQLVGTTYKIKTPLSEHALYVTINDIQIEEQRHPFEIFINCKSMEHFQWVIALTCLISAVFRKGGNVSFMVDQLRSVFDPKGGYFKQGRFIPSLVSEIGDVIEQHLIANGCLVKDVSLQESAKVMIAEKRKVEALNDDGYPENATTCQKCFHRAMVVMDGCATCMNCGDSKCG